MISKMNSEIINHDFKTIITREGTSKKLYTVVCDALNIND